VLAVITANALIGMEGLAILKTGIKFSLSSGSTSDMKMPKTKGDFDFDNFYIHDVSVKKGLLPKLDVSMLIWDNGKRKSFTFQFGLTQDDVKLDEAMKEELENILKCLVSKTGTEYDSEQPIGKKDNEFDFIYGVFGNLHTTVTVNQADIVIKKQKIDDKTKIQTPKGEPITISRPAIDSIKIKRGFSPVPLLSGMVLGAAVGFGIFGGIILFLICTIIGSVASFPKTMIIYRKDGTRFKTVVSGDSDNQKEYERFINLIFK
jgi:hypothetical protein